MNENIDARIANYIAILQNKELANLLGKDVYYKIPYLIYFHSILVSLLHIYILQQYSLLFYYQSVVMPLYQ